MLSLARGWLVGIMMLVVVTVAIGSIAAANSFGHFVTAAALGILCLFIFIAIWTAAYTSREAVMRRWILVVFSIFTVVAIILIEAKINDWMWEGWLLAEGIMLLGLGTCAMLSTYLRGQNLRIENLEAKLAELSTEEPSPED